MDTLIANYGSVPQNNQAKNHYHALSSEILREDLDAKLISMLQENITKTDNNATSAVKKLYSSCMNTSTYKF